jgi:hypothetical protein
VKASGTMIALDGASVTMLAWGAVTATDAVLGRTMPLRS